MTDLGTLNEGGFILAFAISSSGRVVGMSDGQAALWDHGAVTSATVGARARLRLAKAIAPVRYSLPATRRPTCSQGNVSMRDTTSAAAAAQAQAQRQLGGPGRLRLAFEMSVLARELTLARLRGSHPDWSPRQLHRELLRLCFLPDDLPRPLR